MSLASPERHLSMKTYRVWIEIALLGIGISLALALLLASLGAAAGVAVGQVAPSGTTSLQSYDGMITCSRCGARHVPARNQSAATCARTCVHAGAAYDLIEGDSVYVLDGDLVYLKRFAGKRAHVVGTRRGNIIKVLSATDT